MKRSTTVGYKNRQMTNVVLSKYTKYTQNKKFHLDRCLWITVLLLNKFDSSSLFQWSILMM